VDGAALRGVVRHSCGRRNGWSLAAAVLLAGCGGEPSESTTTDPGTGTGAGPTSPTTGADPTTGAGGSTSTGEPGSSSGPLDSSGAESSDTGEPPVTTSTSTSDSDTDPPDLGPCPPGKYLICESFDQTAVGEIPAGWTRHGDPVAVADDASVSGPHALKMGAIPVWERRIYHDAAALPSGHWGRIRYKVQLPVPDAFVHSTLVALYGEGPTTGIQEVRVVDTVKEDVDGFNNDGNGNRFQYLYNVQPNGPEFGKGSDYLWKFDDQWHCAEWHIDGPTQRYDFYIDGELLDQISIANGPGNYEGSEIPDAFSEVRIGWINYQESPPGFTAWIDDVALDDERVGCD
jgi:hypothetical protein